MQPVTEMIDNHPLRFLLAPKSIAIVGASDRPGRPGYHSVAGTQTIGFDGPVYPVSPNYTSVAGLPCYADLQSLPEATDLTIIAGSSKRLFNQVYQALQMGTRSLLAFANPNEQLATNPQIKNKLQDMVREAGVPLMGPYSIGYLNFAQKSAASWVEPATGHLTPGGIVTLIQSGSTYSYAHTTDPRARFCLNLHPGQELDLTIADFIDFALAMPETRVIGLFLEAVRDPEQFVAVLDKATRLGIPIVVVHVGRSNAGAKHVVSHAGKIAGNRHALDAVLSHYGVFRVDTMEAWWANLLLFAHHKRPQQGGVVALTDSGGQRALLADHASQLGLQWTQLTQATEDRLTEQLDPTLSPGNPLDAWGGEPDWRERFENCFRALTSDPDAAIGVMFTDFCVVGSDPVPTGMAEVCRRIAADCEIPVIAAQYTARHFYPENIAMLTNAGIPVLDGGHEALLALTNALSFRDWVSPDAAVGCAELTSAIDLMNAKISQAPVLNEAESLQLLRDTGLPVIEHVCVATETECKAIALKIGYPVALKTAMPGIDHKTEHDGVRLNLHTEAELVQAYRDFSLRLGPTVLVCDMARPGFELSLGMTRDPDFGPLVMIASGGVFIEALNDAIFAVPPFNSKLARQLMEQLGTLPMLLAPRSGEPVNIDSIAEIFSRFSFIAADIDKRVVEIDVNPLIVGEWGCVLVDALMVMDKR